MPDRAAFRYWLLALAVCAVAVVVCTAYVDRPLAEFVEAHLRHTEFWIWLDRALSPLALVVPIALLFLLGCGIWVAPGRQLPGWTETSLLCSWGAVWALAAEIVFKRIFGRAWPDPTYIQNHLYGFRLLHGGRHWDSFPSGTAAISAAIVSVLSIRAPNSRTIGWSIVVVLSAAVVVGNYHWLSDVIAGAFLGASLGWLTVRLLRRTL